MLGSFFGRFMSWRAGALALLSAVAAPAAAQQLPDPATVALPEEAGALRSLTQLLAADDREPDTFLASLDRILVGLRRPTPLRGIVQTLRAEILRYKEPSLPAVDAVEEAARLLPNSSGPLLLAAYIEAYRDNGEAAAGYVLRAADMDPRSVVRTDDYEIGNIIGRLRADHHRPLRQRLIRRLFDIGWRGESVVLRSGLAREVVISRMAEGDLAGAKALIPQLVDPTDVYDLLTLRGVEALWPDLESWAGPRQQTLWRLHLTELRARWKSSGNHQRARDYIYALRQANHSSKVVSDFLPLFESPHPEEDYDTLWIAAPLASSFAQLGRWDEADALLTRLLTVWPVGKDANALNLLANRGRLRHERGNHAAAIADLNAAIADGERREGEVSAGSLAAMHQALACALHQLGRDDETIRSSEFVLASGAPVARVKLHLCFDRKDAARDTLLAGLERPAEREQVIAFMQIESEPPAASALERRLAERRRALRQDPQLLAAVTAHGRILEYFAGAGAPPEAPAVPARRVELRERGNGLFIGSPQPSG